VIVETDKGPTLDELAEYLKLSRTKLYRMAQESEIPTFKIGAQWCFNRKEIDDWGQAKGRMAPPLKEMKKVRYGDRA
jgi:excisionase family DNA binding protein